MLTILLMCGCADDLRNRCLFDGGGGEAIISFSVENIASTRNGQSLAMESEIDHAYLLFYSASGTWENEVPLAAARGEVKSSESAILSFLMPLNLEQNKDYRLVAIANADDYVPSGYRDFKQYLEDWSNNVSSADSNPLMVISSSSFTRDDRLPMNSGVAGECIFRYSMTNGVYDISASLSFRRMVARVDVSNIVRNGFSIEGIALCNWRDSAPVISSDIQFGNRAGNIKASLSGEEGGKLDINFIEMPDANEAGIQQLTQSLYCFPSVSYESYLGDKESTALIIKAKYGDDTQSSYYRINVGMKGNLSKVAANTKYLVTIQSVKGRGASTPEEAYVAKQSPIVLSVVEDWDLEDGHFAMDDFGNFIVVSKGGTLDFDAYVADNIEVKVLTSKGLDWSAEYVSDNEQSASAFDVKRVSDTSLAIRSKGINDTQQPFTGVCRVFAATEGDFLEVNIPLKQSMVDERPYQPVIPTNLPFAIIPQSSERVKIDQDALTIEIDGFDPNCFNSFIDVPFMVYVNESKISSSNVDISSGLQWPLEGRISLDESCFYKYCPESFTNGSVESTSGKTQINNSTSISVEKDKTFYISVGAMGPDDPAIVRSLTLEADNEKVEYSLIIRPRPIIIDDVVLIDEANNIWLIMDRNMQEANTSYPLFPYVGRDSEGKKRQAYNFSGGIEIIIPFKYKDKNGTPFSESLHELYKGNICTFNTIKNTTTDRINWLGLYVYKNQSDQKSNLYDQNNYQSWIFPNKGVVELCCLKMRMSKMRMYLKSDISARKEGKDIPICCYWPYVGINKKETDWYKYGYFIATDNKQTTASDLLYIYYEGGKAICYDWQPDSEDFGLSRLVRLLTEDELEDYKNNELGYDSMPLKRTLCHPDTYGSEVWLPY